jgi:hypothetical protein
MNITAEGKVSGSVGTHYNYAAYNYRDRIGATANFTITLEEDNSPPIIGTPSRDPATAVQPNQAVKISTNVTDPDSGVQNVTLYYTTDSGKTWENEAMSLNRTTRLYEATIPGQQAGTWVRFKIFSCDKVGNNATLDGTQPYCIYQTVPEFPSLLVLPLFMTVTFLAIMTSRKKSALEKK